MDQGQIKLLWHHGCGIIDHEYFFKKSIDYFWIIKNHIEILQKKSLEKYENKI